MRTYWRASACQWTGVLEKVDHLLFCTGYRSVCAILVVSLISRLQFCHSCFDSSVSEAPLGHLPFSHCSTSIYLFTAVCVWLHECEIAHTMCLHECEIAHTMWLCECDSRNWQLPAGNENVGLLDILSELLQCSNASSRQNIKGTRQAEGL